MVAAQEGLSEQLQILFCFVLFCFLGKQDLVTVAQQDM